MRWRSNSEAILGKEIRTMHGQRRRKEGESRRKMQNKNLKSRIRSNADERLSQHKIAITTMKNRRVLKKRKERERTS